MSEEKEKKEKRRRRRTAVGNFTWRSEGKKDLERSVRPTLELFQMQRWSNFEE